jgi:hypothetical protein
MNINLLEIAQVELDEAIEFYNYELLGLGDEFLVEFLKTTDRIIQFPKA